MKKFNSNIFGMSIIYLMFSSCSSNETNKSNIYKESNTSQQLSEYKEVKIGNQIWMGENLNVDTFRNGDPIPEVKSNEEWTKAGLNKEPAWSYYENNAQNGKKFGKLYNWYAVSDKRGLAPKGWHVPTDEEWTILSTNLGGLKNAGKKMKSKYGWKNNDNGNTENGFSGLPGGSRNSFDGIFYSLGSHGFWWSSTEIGVNAWNRVLDNNRDDVVRIDGYKQAGFSVRCIRD